MLVAMKNLVTLHILLLQQSEPISYLTAVWM